MEELNLEGLFWLDNKPDDQVAGRLTFDSTNGACLDLIGSLHEIEETLGQSRILGIAGGKELTLVDCLRTNASMGFPGLFREQYRATLVLSGSQITESQPLEFDTVRIKLRHLDSWIWKTGTDVQIIPDEQGIGIGEIQVTHKPLEKEVVPTDFGELELTFAYGFDPDPFHTTTLTQTALLGAHFSDSRTIEHILETCTTLRNLLTIGVGAPAFFIEATLMCSDLRRDLGDGRTSPIPIGLYIPVLGDPNKAEVKNIHPSQMLFTFDDIGGLEGIARWVRTATKFKTVVGSLLSHWYLPTIYTDNRFLNIIIAAEALERIRQNQQNINFSNGLEGLANYAGKPFKMLVQDVKPWVNEVVRLRINNLVHRGLHGDIEGPRLFWLSESLYFLVVLCLFRECGVAEKTLSKITRHQRFISTAKQLNSTK